jgi:hypothetical protein
MNGSLYTLISKKIYGRKVAFRGVLRAVGTKSIANRPTAYLKWWAQVRKRVENVKAVRFREPPYC